MFPPVPGVPPYPLTYVRPGQGALQPTSGGIEHAAIASYTFSAANIAAGGHEAAITDYYFAVSSTATDPMTARVYYRSAAATTDALLLDFTFPANFIFFTALDPDPIPLGNVNAGDSIVVAIGSFLTDGFPVGGDEMRLDFTLSLIPEPGTISMLAIGAVALLRRRDRC
jgi:hypothetical protein